MKHAKFFSIFVALALSLYGLIGFYFLPLASYDGDLSRMAKLPDVQFLRTKEQPAINPDLMKSAEWKEADILAIGDSFTTSQVWQTVFAQHGVRVRTESWTTIYNICEDISDWIRSNGFKGKYVIIENAEKYHEVRLADSVKCQRMTYHPVPVAPPHLPAVLPQRNKPDYSGSMSVGIQTALNAYKYKQLSAKADFKSWETLNEVQMVRIQNGCELFSHPSCNDVLFYKKDREQDMGINVLENMHIINTRLKDYTTVWVVIPDKATAYLYPDKKFWDEAERRFNAPNVMREFQQAIQKNTVDFYLANDTHVSTTGYILLGNLLYKHIYP